MDDACVKIREVDNRKLGGSISHFIRDRKKMLFKNDRDKK
jgi:hypothetical protein